MNKEESARLDALVTLVTEKIGGRKDASKPYIGLEHIPSDGSELLGCGTGLDLISTNNVFREGDVLFGKLRPGLRKSVCVNFDGYCSTDILVLRPHVPTDASFVSLVLRSDTIFEASRRTEEGTKMPRSSWQSLRSVPIFCPSHQTRAKIAQIVSTLDDTINRTEALINKYRRIKKGLAWDLFERGTTDDDNLRPPASDAPHLYKELSLGLIPRDWDVVALRELFTRRAERGIPGLPIMSITMDRGITERSSVDRRVESNLSPEGHLLVREGDIAYNMMRMWQGVFGRAKIDCLISPAYIVLKPTARISSVFAEQLFSTDYAIAKFKQQSYGIVDDRLRLYFRDLVRIKFAVPRDINEQHKISARLIRVEEALDQSASSLHKLRQLRSGLMADLLTAHVRVTLPKADKEAA